MRVLGVIPARGGSKGIPRKNIRFLGGKPLVAWTIEAARASRRLSRVVLTTEDEEIARVGREWGVEVPFLRPKELAEDDTPTLPVVLHALRECEKTDGEYDAVCLLQPTAPFRKGEWIDACIDLLEESGADAVVTVCRIPEEYHPRWALEKGSGGWLRFVGGQGVPPRRQELPAAYHREGSVYVSRRRVLVEGSLYGERLAGYEVSGEETVNLDTEADWRRAEGMIAEMGRGQGCAGLR
jgi:CMP-N-acetylneuraminic acid synthetase